MITFPWRMSDTSIYFLYDSSMMWETAEDGVVRATSNEYKARSKFLQAILITPP